MRINIESSALAEGRFHRLVNEDFFEGSRIEAVGALALFWHDSQEREFVIGTKDEIVKLLPYLTEEVNSRVFDLLLKHDYIKQIDENLFEIAGNEKHVEKIKHLRSIKSEAGKKGNEVRWGNKESQNIADDSQAIAEHRCNSTQLNSTQLNSTQRKKNIADADFDFERLYEKYPRKIGRKKGIEACKRTILTQEAYESLESAIQNYTSHCRKERIEPRFIKHFSTFINCWTDWVEVLELAATPNGPPSDTLEGIKQREAEAAKACTLKPDKVKELIARGFKKLNDDSPGPEAS